MNKRIIVAGGTGGIGSSIVKKLSSHYKVVVMGRNRDKFNSMNFDSEVEFIDIDEDIGKKDSNIFINCIGQGYYGNIEDISMDEFDRSYNDNLRTPVKILKEIVKNYKRKKCGWIININSISGLRGFYSGALYCSFKFALRGFFEVLEKEIARTKIRVTEIFPGIVDTPLTDKMPKTPKKETLISPHKISSVLLNMIKNDIYMRKVKIKNDNIEWK
ncbi:MAG: SDR family oxidoreductase [Candidatus Mcinerneyibacterium aminivorans]|uniref:SDR family oxidoreductase n=1 Tax=Candidatus Mcinerneyibacterium aminivorans TaxID=2703815 RepID=A0A5D0MDH5_9BACT|nr:MAG: SDR family oxidoreductase [Candidatus Mcinerneyibacterium aminivorans]